MEEAIEDEDYYNDDYFDNPFQMKLTVKEKDMNTESQLMKMSLLKLKKKKAS